ncbi:MAG: glycosyltransferase family 2 protein [Desulfovibrionaceae bacterium]|nr:glycosyltransferase family 2 protein [Desulfovibrionaceae bacterium]
MTQTPQQQAASLVNLALMQMGRGNQEKFLDYLDRAHAAWPDAPAPGAGAASLEALLLHAPFAAAFAAFHGPGSPDAAAVARVAETHPQTPLLASMASAALLKAGDGPGAAAFLDAHGAALEPDELALKRRTAALLPVLAAHPDPEPRVHLVVLCHDREDYVGRAVRELAATDYRNYAVYFADNGSTDRTWEELNQALAAFPAHVEVHAERLPTNVGRPAGHNWLLTAHDHSAAEFIAIGDDDLTRVPPDWLARMVNTARAFDHVGAVGPKAINPGRPKIIHGGVRRFEYFREDRFAISNEGNEVDCGQHDFADFVDHVIGCLHIYDKRALDEVGLFDIRFSPCQLVDIDHHLRLRLAGWRIAYNGLVEVEHYRAMGRKAAKDRALAGNSLGNVIKLLHKHDAAHVQAFIEREAAARSAWLSS